MGSRCDVWPRSRDGAPLCVLPCPRWADSMVRFNDLVYPKEGFAVNLITLRRLLVDQIDGKQAATFVRESRRRWSAKAIQSAYALQQTGCVRERLKHALWAWQIDPGWKTLTFLAKSLGKRQLLALRRS